MRRAIRRWGNIDVGMGGNRVLGFGPFEVGVGIEAVEVAIGSDATDIVFFSAGMFSFDPTDISDAAFDAGRLVALRLDPFRVNTGTAAVTLRLPILVDVTDVDRWLGVRVETQTEAADGGIAVVTSPVCVSRMADDKAEEAIVATRERRRAARLRRKRNKENFQCVLRERR